MSLIIYGVTGIMEQKSNGEILTVASDDSSHETTGVFNIPVKVFLFFESALQYANTRYAIFLGFPSLSIFWPEKLWATQHNH